MKILISPTTLEETRIVSQSAAEIIDIKNVKEGSLGAHAPAVIKQIVETVRPYGKTCSATLGDLPYKPGTAALAALGLATCKVDYIKAGLWGTKNYKEALELITAIVITIKEYNPSIIMAASGYADWRRIEGLPPKELIMAAKDGKADIVMLDTYIKDGHTLFDNMTFDELKCFIDLAKSMQLKVALAGSLQKHHLLQLTELAPDIIGVRGSVCEKGNRNAGITKEALDHFLSLAMETSNCPVM